MLMDEREGESTEREGMKAYDELPLSPVTNSPSSSFSSENNNCVTGFVTTHKKATS